MPKKKYPRAAKYSSIIQIIDDLRESIDHLKASSSVCQDTVEGLEIEQLIDQLENEVKTKFDEMEVEYKIRLKQQRGRERNRAENNKNATGSG